MIAEESHRQRGESKKKVHGKTEVQRFRQSEIQIFENPECDRRKEKHVEVRVEMANAAQRQNVLFVLIHLRETICLAAQDKR